MERPTTVIYRYAAPKACLLLVNREAKIWQWQALKQHEQNTHVAVSHRFGTYSYYIEPTCAKGDAVISKAAKTSQ